MVYKWRTLDKRITELKARLASGTEEDESAVMATLAKYHAVRVKIARTAGRLI